MPSLGFLKKKRTKDSSNDSPTSPTKDEHSTTQPQENSKENNNTSAPLQDPSSTNQPSSQAAPMNPSGAIATNSQQQSNAPTIQSLLNQNPDQSSPSPAQNAGGGADQTVQQSRDTRGKYTLGDFAIQRTLGTGSFGRVHLVQSRHNQRYYAIKVLKKAQVVKMKQVEHTNDERKMLQRVKHPFLITLWGTFQDSRNLYMVMDFIEGGELFSLLRKSQVSIHHNPLTLCH
jgi:protein kinase A